MPALERKPVLNWLQAEALNGFWLMSAGRPVGFNGPLGIPAADIVLTAQALGLDPGWYLRVVRAMDSAYLDTAEKRRQAHGHSKTRSSSGPKPVPERRK